MMMASPSSLDDRPHDGFLLPMKTSTAGEHADENESSCLHSFKGLMRRPQFQLGVPHVLALVGAGVLIGVAIGDIGGNESQPHVLSSQEMPSAKDDATTSDVDSFGELADYTGNEEESDGLKLVWEMSFPNSGTSYTSKLLRHATMMATASNYGTGNKDEKGKSVHVFEGTSGGPFWTEPQHTKYSRPKSGYLLTKTHCGSRCFKCGPSSYIETQHMFLNDCLSGTYLDEDETGEIVEKVGQYDKSLVHKAVHLIRNPFDNIVSRFHLEYKHFVREDDKEKIELYPRSREGFRAFCKGTDDAFRSDEKSSKFVENDVLEMVKNVPCHGDFFRYLQWHNLAFTTTQNLDIPTFVLHYERYEDEFDETLTGLLEFLGQEFSEQGDTYDFVKGKQYRDYFDPEEVDAIASMMKELAYADTWKNIKHYFE